MAELNLDDCCGICLEEFKVRPCSSFHCLNHVAHTDCLKVWEESCKKKNELEFLCIYRCVKKDVKV